jgi:hypothetical protein
MTELIITNGDSAAGTLREAGRTDTILPWRDVLHEGPIAAVGLAELSARRAPFLAQRFHLPEIELAAGFAERDAVMARHGDFDAIELWFEHDLYDQLQLLQVLSFFAGEGRVAGLVLVQADDFLGPQTARTILRFAQRARPVTQADLDLGATVWSELAQATPQPIGRRTARAVTRSMPFLVPALRRFLEELPSESNGLGRTEQTVLDLIAEGRNEPKTLFGEAMKREEAAFMGDSSFFHLIEDLAFAEVPLIAGLAARGLSETDPDRFVNTPLELTVAGEEVMAGEDDHVALSGIDRWWGGTRLLGRSTWRYDRAARRLVAPVETGA